MSYELESSNIHGWIDRGRAEVGWGFGLHLVCWIWNDAGCQGCWPGPQTGLSICMVVGTWRLWSAAAWWKNEGTSLWTLLLCTWNSSGGEPAHQIGLLSASCPVGRIKIQRLSAYWTHLMRWWLFFTLYVSVTLEQRSAGNMITLHAYLENLLVILRGV